MALGDETTQNDATGDLALGRLAEALAATSGADAWQAHARREEEAQLYLIGEKVESRRNVTTERTRAVVHNSHAPHNPEPESAESAAGSAAITLLPEEIADSTRLATRLREAVAMAALTDNRPYEQPAPSAAGYPAVEVSDPALTGDLGAVLDDLRTRMETEVARHPDVRISSAGVLRHTRPARHTHERRRSRQLSRHVALRGFRADRQRRRARGRVPR